MSYKKEIEFLKEKRKIDYPVLYVSRTKSADQEFASTQIRTTEESLIFKIGDGIQHVHFEAFSDVDYEEDDFMVTTNTLSVGKDPDSLSPATIEPVTNKELSEIIDNTFVDMSVESNSDDFMLVNRYRLDSDDDVLDAAMKIRETIVQSPDYEAAWVSSDSWVGASGDDLVGHNELKEYAEEKELICRAMAISIPVNIISNEQINKFSSFVESQHDVSVNKLLELKQVLEKSGDKSDVFLRLLSRYSNEAQDNMIYYALSKSELELSNFITRNQLRTPLKESSSELTS